MQVHQRKGHLKLLRALTRQGKNCECHSAHSCLFINILGSGSYMLVSSTNQAQYILHLINISTIVTR